MNKGILDFDYSIYDSWNEILNDALDTKNRIQDTYAPQISAMEQLIRRQKEFNIELREAERSNRIMNERITSIYEQTDDYTRRELERKIREHRAILANPFQIIREQIYDGSRMRETDNFVRISLDGESVRKTEVGLAHLLRQLESINNRGRGTTDNFANWVRLLSQATGYTNEMVLGLGGTETIRKYASEVEAVRDRLLDSMPNGGLIYEVLGLNRADLYEDAASKLRDLARIMTESGIREFNGTTLPQVFAELKKFEESALGERGTEFLNNLGNELKDAGKSTYELAVKRLVIEQRISEEAARQTLGLQKQIDYITNGYDFMGTIMTQIDDALRSIRVGDGGYGQYTSGRFAQIGMDMIQGSDVGNFMQGFEKGGIWGGILETLLGALVNVVGGIDELGKAMNPVTELFQRLEGVISFFHEILTQIFDDLIDAFKPVFALFGEILQAIKPLVSEVLSQFTDMLKDIFATLMPLIAIIRKIAPLFQILGNSVRMAYEALRMFANLLTFGLFDKMVAWSDTIQLLNDEQQNEYERLKAINEQYRRLFDALKQQEEYYLQQRRHLNSQWDMELWQNSRSVNDMILSPHGAFSTHPKDYIIATKNPESLMGGGGVHVTVNNYADATITTQERTGANGMKELIVTVKGIVNQGLANGDFDGGWDAMSARRGGRRLVHV